MASPTYEEIMGGSAASTPSYEEITGAGSRQDDDFGEINSPQNSFRDEAGTPLGSVPIGQEISELHQQALSQPIFRIPQTSPDFQREHGVLAGLADTAGGVVNFLQSGEGLGVMAMPGAPALLRAGVGLGFAAQGATDAPEAINRIAEGFSAGNPYEATMGVGQLGLDAGMLHGGLSPSRFTSTADQSARSLIRQTQYPAPIGPVPDSAPVSASLPASGQTAEPPAAQPSSPEQATSPGDLVPALKIGDQVVAGQPGDNHEAVFHNFVTANGGADGPHFEDAVLALSDDSSHVFQHANGDVLDRQQAADALGETTPLQSERLRDLQAAPAVIEPRPSGQGRSPIAGGERTPEEGATAPAIPQPAVRLGDGTLLTGESHSYILQKQLEDALANGTGLPEKGQRGYLMPDGSFTANLLDVARAANPSLGRPLISRTAAAPSYEEVVNKGEPAPSTSAPPPVEPPPPSTQPEPTPDDSRRVIGMQNAMVDQRRIARGDLPRMEPAAISGGESWDEAMGRIANDRDYADKLISSLRDGSTKTVDAADQMAILHRQIELENERDGEADKAADMNTSADERAAASQRFRELENKINEAEQASSASGTHVARALQIRQQMRLDDFSSAGIQRRMRAAKMEPLTEEEVATSKEQAAQVRETQVDADAKQKAYEDALKQAQDAADLTHAHAQTIKELEAEKAKGTGFTDIVLTQAQKIVDRLRARAEASKLALRNSLSQMNAGVDPTVILHVANILAHKVGEFGLEKTKAFSEMVEEYGPKIQPFLEKAWKKVKGLIGDETPDKDVKKAVRAGAGGKGPVDPIARLKADAAAGDELSHKGVYDIWRSKIRAGITDAEAAAKATHEMVKQSYPNATEQQVKEAFSEYGKAKFPSKEADKVKLAEHRRITQLQLSIDRLNAGLDPLKSGLQRDKATQEIRDKQKELNALLKQKAGPPSPEQLASRNEARVTSLKNQIEDLDRQLRTGEAPPESGAPLPDSPEVERLKAERDAMKAKVSEIENEANPGPTDEQRYNKARMAQIERESKKAQARLDANDYGPRPVKQPKELFAETATAHAKLETLRQKIREGEQKYRDEHASPSQKAWGAVSKVLKAPRDIAVFGHGTVGMFTHAGGVALRPTRMASFWEHFGEQFKLMLNPQHYAEALHKLKTDPEFEHWKAAGLNIDPDTQASDYGAMSEELSSLFKSTGAPGFLSRWQQAGNRGFFALKMVRLAMSKADWEEAPQELKSDPATAKELRRFIADMNNKATGTLTRGNSWLNQGARWAPIREGLFAPKLLFSKVARTLVDPVKTGATLYDWAKGGASDVEKYAAVKRMKNAGWFIGTALGALATNQAILSATGSKQEVNFSDPSKSDWLSFKMAGKTVSPYGGLLDILKFVGHLLHDFGGTLTPQQARDGRGSTALNTTGKFLRSKLTPFIGTVVDTATGYDINSRPVPQRNERQKFADAPRYSWLEYLLTKGPIPLSQGVRGAFDAMRQTGLSKPEALDILSSAESMASGLGEMALGATGIHASTDYSIATPKRLMRSPNNNGGVTPQKRLLRTQ